MESNKNIRFDFFFFGSRFGLIFVLNNNDQIFLSFFWKEKILLRKVIKKKKKDRVNVWHILFIHFKKFITRN